MCRLVPCLPWALPVRWQAGLSAQPPQPSTLLDGEEPKSRQGECHALLVSGESQARRWQPGRVHQGAEMHCHCPRLGASRQEPQGWQVSLCGASCSAGSCHQACQEEVWDENTANPSRAACFPPAVPPCLHLTSGRTFLASLSALGPGFFLSGVILQHCFWLQKRQSRGSPFAPAAPGQDGFCSPFLAVETQHRPLSDLQVTSSSTSSLLSTCVCEWKVPITWRCHLVTSQRQGVCSRQGNTGRGLSSKDARSRCSQAQQTDLCFIVASRQGL